MVRKKAKGFSYVGKEVQTHDFRVDKEFFINRSKASSQGKVNGLDVDQSGKVIVSPKAIAGITIDDDTAAIDVRDLEPGILTITPTASRIKPTPTAAQIITQFGFTEFYQNADIPIVNLATANYSLTLTAGTDVTLVGNMTIKPNSTGLFRFVASNADIDEITIYRISGSDSTTVDNLLAGNGIDLSSSTGNITVSAETSSATNPGVVELATTAEADTGTDTARAVTPAGLKSHVDGRYQYQYISFLSNMATASNWKGMSANGISNHSWNQTLATSGTTVDSSTGTVPVACIGAGIIIPHASTLVGFSATGMGGSNHQYELGLMVGVPTFNDAATFSATLRAYAAAVVSGPDNNYSGRPLAIQDLSRSYSITAGHSIYPCVKSASGSGTNKVSWTIVLKTLIPS